MVAWVRFAAVAAVVIAAVGTAGASPYQPSPGPGAVPTAPGTNGAGDDPALSADPYEQPDFSNAQSFGLIASQMLGAAAACEQLHSQRISLGERAMAKTRPGSGDDRAAVDAAQQHMLDPAAVTPSGPGTGDADCNRLTGAFNRLQEVEMQNQTLAKDLDQPDAMSPSPGNAKK